MGIATIASTRNFRRHREEAIQYASGKPIARSSTVTEVASRMVSQNACQSISTDSVTAPRSISDMVTGKVHLITTFSHRPGLAFFAHRLAWKFRKFWLSSAGRGSASRYQRDSERGLCL